MMEVCFIIAGLSLIFVMISLYLIANLADRVKFLEMRNYVLTEHAERETVFRLWLTTKEIKDQKAKDAGRN